jgi:Uma2 family endonuclease
MAVGFRFTQADLELLPEIEGVRYEIIDGELYVSTQPTEPHQYACTILSAHLVMWSSQSGTGITLQAPGLVFPDGDNVAPDVVWISSERRAEALDGGGHYRLAPEIVGEVLSPGGVNERLAGSLLRGLPPRRRDPAARTDPH